MSVEYTEPISHAGNHALMDQLASLVTMQEQLGRRMEERFDELFGRLTTLENQCSESQTSDHDTASPPSLDWEAKKRAIYKEHAMADEVSDLIRPTPSSELTQAVNDTRNELDEIHQCDNLNGSLEINEVDHQEIERLKTELHEKLRLAEMELSVSRAKIIQETAQLEDQRHELEKLAAQIPEPPNTQENKKRSVLDRLSRHMIPVRKSGSS